MNCEICNKEMLKKDSVMTTKVICSVECKKEHKSRLPKRVTSTSIQYWTNQGYSESEAIAKISEIQRKRSKRCIEYWLEKGYSNEAAKEQVKLWQSELGKKNLTKYSKEDRQKRSPFSPKYWLNKGYSEEETREILSNRADGSSLSYYVNTYGEELGTEKYKKFCEYRAVSTSLSSYIEKYGEELGKEIWGRKYKNRHNSQLATEFFIELAKLLPTYKIYTASNEFGEYGVLDQATRKYYFYDFVVPDLKLCVEFNGDYWHCNPEKYDSDYKHLQSGFTAKEIWEKDKSKIELIERERGFSTVVVWESDDRQQALKTILEKVNELSKD